MKVQAEVSVYPLRGQRLSGYVGRFRHIMDTHGLAVKTGAMSTKVAGDSRGFFRGLSDAFEELGEKQDVVLVCKVPNACGKSAGRDEADEILDEIQKVVQGDKEAAGLDIPPALSADSRNLIALAAAIARQREASVIEICVQQSLASGATPESVMQVVAQATQMAELPAARYAAAARRGIEAFGARDGESAG